MKIYVCKGHVGNKKRLSGVYCIQLNLFVFIYRDWKRFMKWHLRKTNSRYIRSFDMNKI